MATVVAAFAAELAEITRSKVTTLFGSHLSGGTRSCGSDGAMRSPILRCLNPHLCTTPRPTTVLRRDGLILEARWQRSGYLGGITGPRFRSPICSEPQLGFDQIATSVAKETFFPEKASASPTAISPLSPDPLQSPGLACEGYFAFGFVSKT